MKLAKKDIDWTLLSQELLKNPELTNLTINVPNRILKTTKQNLTKFYSTGGHTQGPGINKLFKELHHVKANQYFLGLNLRFKFYWNFLSILHRIIQLRLQTGSNTSRTVDPSKRWCYYAKNILATTMDRKFAMPCCDSLCWRNWKYL